MDDDEVGLSISRDALTVREGENATYTVRLNSQPKGSARMRLNVTGTDAEEVAVDPESIVFTAQSWNSPRTVTVTTTRDGDGTEDSAEIGHTIVGGGYDDISGVVAITVDDIDEASRSVQIVMEPNRVEEDAGTTTVEITATLDQATRSVATEVELSASAGTATSGTDFENVPVVMIRIPAGQMSATQTFHFSPIEDNIDEGLSESVIFSGTTDGASGRRSNDHHRRQRRPGDRAERRPGGDRGRRPKRRELHRYARDAAHRRSHGAGKRRRQQ